MADVAVATQKKKGVDSSAFLTMAKSKTFLAPIADSGAEVTAVMNNAIESVLLGKADATTALKAANAKANELVKR